MFLERCYQADSGTFWDTEESVNQAFEADWSRARFSRVVRQPEQVEETRELLFPMFMLIKEIFRYFSACGLHSPHVLNISQYVW